MIALDHRFELFGIEINPLEVFFKRRLKAVHKHGYPHVDLVSWLLEENEAHVPMAHVILSTLSTQAIQKMFLFISESSEADIYAFLMLRNREEKTLGHTLFGQTRFHVEDLVREGLSQVFFLCLEKISISYRGDVLRVTTNHQTLHDVIDLMGQGNAAIKSAYAYILRTSLAQPKCCHTFKAHVYQNHESVSTSAILGNVGTFKKPLPAIGQQTALLPVDTNVPTSVI